MFPISLNIKYHLLKLIVFAFSFAAESRGGQLVELQLLKKLRESQLVEIGYFPIEIWPNLTYPNLTPNLT